jgi:hypothetical protein
VEFQENSKADRPTNAVRHPLFTSSGSGRKGTKKNRLHLKPRTTVSNDETKIVVTAPVFMLFCIFIDY